MNESPLVRELKKGVTNMKIRSLKKGEIIIPDLSLALFTRFLTGAWNISPIQIHCSNPLTKAPWMEY
jgi:hypothetical protein